MANQSIEKLLLRWQMEAHAINQNENWLSAEGKAHHLDMMQHWHDRYCADMIPYQQFTDFMNNTFLSIVEELQEEAA